jgi:hypothetical protein
MILPLPLKRWSLQFLLLNSQKLRMMTGVESSSPPFKTRCMALKARVMEAVQGNATNAVTI